MTCETCTHWVTIRKTVYGDGSEVETFQASTGKGRCEKLDIDTLPEFGCISFQDEGPDHHPWRISHKPGVPWQYWTMGNCPDCNSKGNSGDGACHRCAGTGKVRYYEDGYIGEERTRLHPKERETAPKPKCGGCSKDVDIGWVACPFCGHKLEPVAPVETVSGLVASNQGA
jgi:hypothetical protein